MDSVNFYDGSPYCSWAHPAVLYRMSVAIRNGIFVRIAVVGRGYGAADNTIFIVPSGGLWRCGDCCNAENAAAQRQSQTVCFDQGISLDLCT
jgi:hypothetical protein